MTRKERKEAAWRTAAGIAAILCVMASLSVSAGESCSGCRPGASALLCDPEDQIRYCSTYDPYFHEKIRDMGFNFVVFTPGFQYDYKKGVLLQYDREKDKAILKRLADDGISCVPVLFGSKPTLAERYPRIDREGKPKRAPDAAHPGYLKDISAAAEAMGRELAALGSPAIAGFRGLEEVRLGSQPSFAPHNIAAYKAYSGHDIPSAAAERECPGWRDIPDMPADRIVDDTFPLLNYYVWHWRHGDGWSHANDVARKAFERGFGRSAVSVYAPALRMPSLWGVGGGNSHLLDWLYLYPAPFVISYQISELQAAARGTGAATISSFSGYVRSTICATRIGKMPKKLPPWFKGRDVQVYLTVPPDWANEGCWLMAARQTDGIGLGGAAGVIGLPPGGKDWTSLTNTNTVDVVGTFFRAVARPLGPLLRNMPEHPPETAVLASYASLILSGSAPGMWNTYTKLFGELTTRANLNAMTLFEEEIERSGIPPSVRTIYMPNCAVLTRTTADALLKFRARGGRVVGEDTLAPGVAADATMKNYADLFTSIGAYRAKESDADFRAAAKALRDLAGFETYCGSENPWLIVSARSMPGADLVFAVNDKREAGDYLGEWGRVLEKGSPNSGTVRVNRAAAAVYDVVAHRQVKFRSAGGRTEIPVAFSTSDGRAFLVTSRPLAPLSVRAERVGKGVVVEVSSPDIDVMVPISVEADGLPPRAGIVRNGKWRREFPCDIDAVSVMNLADGKTVKVRVQSKATGGASMLDPLPNEALVFGDMGPCIVGRMALWPDVAPEEQLRERGHYAFDETNQVWRMRDVAFPEVVLFKPREVRSNTLVLGVPGGGYNSQNLKTFCCNVRPILESGRWVAVLHHRLPRRKGRPIYAAPREDGARAVRILRAQAAQYGYAPERIGAVGFSAGGNLVTLLATASQDEVYARVDAADDLSAHLNFAIPVYPAYVLDDGAAGTNVNRGMDAKLLPHFKFDAKTPPMFMIHGDDDPFSPMASVKLYEELRRRQIPAQLFVYARAGHGLGEGCNVAGWQSRIVDWLDRMGF